MIPTRHLPSALLVGVCAVMLGGCSSSNAAEPVGIDKAQIIKTLNDAARQTLGAPFDHVDCDRGLDPVIGNRARCVAEAAGVRAAFDVSVTSIDKGNLNFDWTLDENSRVLTAAAIEKEVRPMFKDRAGTDLKTLSCLGDVPGRIDGTGTCTATGADGVDRKVTVHVTGADGMGVAYEWNVDIPKPDPKHSAASTTTAKRPTPN